MKSTPSFLLAAVAGLVLAGPVAAQMSTAPQGATAARSDLVAARLLDALTDWQEDAAILLAGGDATAIAYRAVAQALPTRTDVIDTDSHSFARAADKIALRKAVLAALTG